MLSVLMGLIFLLILFWIIYAVFVAMVFGAILEIKAEKVVHIATLGIISPKMISSLREDHDGRTFR